MKDAVAAAQKLPARSTLFRSNDSIARIILPAQRPRLSTAIYIMIGVIAASFVMPCPESVHIRHISKPMQKFAAFCSAACSRRY